MLAVGRILKRFLSLPISMEAVCSYFDIDLYLAGMRQYDAFYMTHGASRIIVVNDNLSRGRQRFSIHTNKGMPIWGTVPSTCRLGVEGQIGKTSRAEARLVCF